MGIKEINILLDNQFAAYYPGQKLNGKIEYTLDSPKKIRGLCVKFKGHASTSISRSESYRQGDKTHYRTVHYTGSEDYFNMTYYIIGSENGETIEIPTGKNSYPFSCQLPFNLPSSFEGELGYVRYTIKVTIDRPWKFNQDSKMAFTIVSDLDLNSSPEYKAPIHFQLEKTLGCFCCKTGNVSVDVRIPVRGFCPGQSIPLDITCENQSASSLDDIKIRLRKIVTFRTHTPRTITEEKKMDLADMSLGEVKAHMSLNWQPLFTIPPLPPSNLLHCSIIDVRYEIKVACSPTGCHTDFDEMSPVYLGTIPIEGFQSPSPQAAPSMVEEDNSQIPLLSDNSMAMPGSPYPMPNESLDPSAPQIERYYPVYPNSSGASAPPPSYNSLFQPTYQECQFTAKSIRGPEDHADTVIHGRTDFAPRYPTYGFVLPQK